MSVRTVYEGPVEETELCFSGRALKVVRPSDPDRLLNDPDVLELNRRDDYMPYWAYLWPGAYLLAEAVARESWNPGDEALEIGCGLGLAGLVALNAGLRVQFSDYDETPLEFVKRSAAANGVEASRFATRRLDWRHLPSETFPVILGADVLYERRLVPLVTRLIDQLLAPGGRALVAGPYRVATEDLDACLAEHGLTAEAVPLTTRDEHDRLIRGTIHRIERTV